MRQYAIQLIQAVVFQCQFTSPFGRVLYLDSSAKCLGKSFFQPSNIGIAHQFTRLLVRCGYQYSAYQ